MICPSKFLVSPKTDSVSKLCFTRFFSVVGLASIGMGLAGCEKAKELANNAVTQIKKEINNAEEKPNNRGTTRAQGKNRGNTVSENRQSENRQSENRQRQKEGVTTRQSKAGSFGQTDSKPSVDRFLRLGSKRVQDKDIIALTSDAAIAGSITELKLSGANISAKAFEAMAKFPNLERLDLTRVNATVGNMQLVGEISWLKALNLSYNQLTDADFAHIGSLSQLEEINITGTQITDEGFRCFKPMSNMSLMIMDRMGALSGKGFRYVNGNSLKEIRANGSSIGYYAFASLGGSKSLEVLWLNGARVTDKAMQGIGRCVNLREIYLENNDLTNQGVSYLKNHKSLEKVVLARNRGLTNQALGFLTKVKNLQLVNVHGTMCAPVVEAEFSKYLPSCKLVF